MLEIAIELGEKHWDREAIDKVKEFVPHIVHGKGNGAEQVDGVPTEREFESKTPETKPMSPKKAKERKATAKMTQEQLRDCRNGTTSIGVFARPKQ